MIHTIRVRTKNGTDRLGNSVLQEIHKRLSLKDINRVETAKLYRLEGITENQAKILAEKLLCEDINQIYTLNKPIFGSRLEGNRQKSLLPGGSPELVEGHDSWDGGTSRDDSFEMDSVVIEIAYKPGVMNPEVASIIKAAKDLEINLTAADSSMEYSFSGIVKKGGIKEIISKLNLYNKTVEHIIDIPPKTLIIKAKPGETVVITIRKMGDSELAELSKDKLFLNMEEMKLIKNYFTKIKRDPTDCELETIAQTWSEHCAHKTFKARLVVDGQEKEPLITRLKKEALKHNKNIVSAFIDNSGVIDFYDGMSICGKVETHNSPSAIEPYGGAMTGSGGVFRDIAGTGLSAKTIASTDIFCFANPDLDTKLLPTGCLPPEYLLKRVVDGIRDYGNRMGIPTNNGSVHFHNDFRAKPTVIAGAYGIIPKTLAQKREPLVGDLVVVVGGHTGRDGIHGATFSSGEMTHDTINVNSSAVQIGNAIEEKRMFDAILEARDKNLIRAIQDCGAGGFSSAIGEMGEKIGVKVDLKKAPLKYHGLSPWEIWISESQERMALSIPKTKLKEFLDICKKYNVEATVLGQFDGDKKIKVYFGPKLVCNLDTKFLYHGLPWRTMIATKPIPNKETPLERSLLAKKTPQSPKEWVSILKQVLSHPNVCSKEPIVRLYDHTVQGTNVLQPFSGVELDGPNNSAVIKPILNKPYGMVISHGLNPVLNNIDPYKGSIWAGVEALSNFVAVGGNYKDAALINNYIWPFPDSESLWSLDKSVDAVVDLMKTFKIPVVSGKDSLSSTYRGKDGKVIKIPPVLCISVFGKIKDVLKTVTSDFKKIGSLIYLVGKMDFKAMTGSIYLESCHPGEATTSIGSQGDSIASLQNDDYSIPNIDLELLPKVFNSIYNGIQKNQILSIHDISEGGLITSVFEMCVGGEMGVNLHLGNLEGDSLQSKVSPLKNTLRPDYFLFNETAGSFIVEIGNENIAKQIFKDIPYVLIGRTKKENNISVENLFEADVDSLKRVWKEPMKKIFG